MLDLIYEAIRYDRDKTVDDVVDSDRWHSLLKSDEFCGGSETFVADYESTRESKQRILDEKMALWYTLPTSK